MRGMSEYIRKSGRVRTLAALISDEIGQHEADLPSCGDFSESERNVLYPVLQRERLAILSDRHLMAQSDSVKGESAMIDVYPEGGQKKAVDIVTSRDDLLVLSELKILMKLHGRGPFGGPGSFKERISGKFNAMNVILGADGEIVDPLRIIVVSEEQFPTSRAHIEGLLCSDYARGSFSDDRKQYRYALCTSRVLRQVVDAGASGSIEGDCLYFQI